MALYLAVDLDGPGSSGLGVPEVRRGLLAVGDCVLAMRAQEGDSMSVQFVGTAALIAKAQAALTEGITAAGEDLLAKCQAATPVATGTLRGSEHVEITSGGGSAEATVSTGGEASQYAIYVHEGTYKMAARKYLENPLIDNAPLYAAFLAKAVGSEF
jgi:HK97 gp10 family phage protein